MRDTIAAVGSHLPRLAPWALSLEMPKKSAKKRVAKWEKRGCKWAFKGDNSVPAGFKQRLCVATNIRANFHSDSRRC